MFKIKPNPEFSVEIELHVPGQEPGKVNFTFKYLDADQLKAWREKHGNSDLFDSLNDVIVGWSGIEDESGKPVEYSADKLKQLLTNYLASGTEITQGYMREVLGSRRKN